MNYFSVLVLPFFLLVGGCAKPPAPKDAQVSQKPLPSWYTSPKSNDDKYLYGIGSGENLEEAKNSALSALISKLGTTIESSFETSIEVSGLSNQSVKKEVKSNIKANVSKIRVSNYEVISSQKVSYKETLVLVRSDRVKFSKALKSDLEEKISAIKIIKNRVENVNYLEQYNTYYQLKQDVDALITKIVVLEELNPLLNTTKYSNFVNTIDVKFEKSKESLSFYVSSDTKSKQFAQVIKNFLASKSLKIANKKSKNVININITTDSRISDMGSIKVAVFTINVKAYAKNREIGGKVLIKKERYSSSMQTAKKNAVVHFEDELQTQTINDILGLEIKF
jgi:hypothetical protein